MSTAHLRRQGSIGTSVVFTEEGQPARALGNLPVKADSHERAPSISLIDCEALPAHRIGWTVQAAIVCDEQVGPIRLVAWRLLFSRVKISPTASRSGRFELLLMEAWAQTPCTQICWALSPSRWLSLSDRNGGLYLARCFGPVVSMHAGHRGSCMYCTLLEEPD